MKKFSSFPLLALLLCVGAEVFFSFKFEFYEERKLPFLWVGAEVKKGAQSTRRKSQ